MYAGIRSNLSTRSFCDGKLDEIRDHGFSAVELSFNYEPDELPWDDKACAHRIRKEAEDLGLILTAHLPDDMNLATAAPAESAAHVERLLSILAGVREYGPTLAVLHAEGCSSPQAPSAETRDAQRNTFYSNLSRIAPVCERLGIRLLIETMTPGNRLTAGLSEILETVSSIHSPGLGICIDTNHMNLSEHLPDAILRASPYLGEVHCSDNYGEKENHLMLYDGVIAWGEVAHALAEASFDGPLILETVHFDNTNFASRLEAAATTATRFMNEIRQHQSTLRK